MSMIALTEFHLHHSLCSSQWNPQSAYFANNLSRSLCRFMSPFNHAIIHWRCSRAAAVLLLINRSWPPTISWRASQSVISSEWKPGLHWTSWVRSFSHLARFSTIRSVAARERLLAVHSGRVLSVLRLSKHQSTRERLTRLIVVPDEMESESHCR